MEREVLVWLKKTNGSFKNHAAMSKSILSGASSRTKKCDNQALLKDQQNQQQQPNLNIDARSYIE